MEHFCTSTFAKIVEHMALKLHVCYPGPGCRKNVAKTLPTKEQKNAEHTSTMDRQESGQQDSDFVNDIPSAIALHEQNEIDRMSYR